MNTDSFVIIQSWLNIAEAVISFLAVFLCLSSCKIKNGVGAILCLVVSAFVFWKTVIFVWYDHDWLTADAKNFVPNSILCYYLPSSLWIILPIVSMYAIGKKLVTFATKNIQDSPKTKNKSS